MGANEDVYGVLALYRGVVIINTIKGEQSTAISIFNWYHDMIEKLVQVKILPIIIVYIIDE